MHPLRPRAQFHEAFADRQHIAGFRVQLQVVAQVAARAGHVVHLQVGQAAVAQGFRLVGHQLEHAVGAARGAVPFVAFGIDAVQVAQHPG